jgi:hypothetical protein
MSVALGVGWPHISAVSGNEAEPENPAFDEGAVRRDCTWRHDHRSRRPVSDERDVLNPPLGDTNEAGGWNEVEWEPRETEEDELTRLDTRRGQPSNVRPVQLDRDSVEARIRHDHERPSPRRQRFRRHPPVVTLETRAVDDQRERPQLDETCNGQQRQPHPSGGDRCQNDPDPDRQQRPAADQVPVKELVEPRRRKRK